MLNRRLIGVALAASAALVLVAAGPASAVAPYVTNSHPDTTGVTNENGANAVVEPVGLRFETIPDTSRSNFEIFLLTVGGTTFVPLSSVEEMFYNTIKLDTTPSDALPAYKIALYCSQTPFSNPAAATFVTLVFEPSLQPSVDTSTFNTWRTWNVKAGHLWATRILGADFGGNVGEPNRFVVKPFADIVTTYCPYSAIISYGAGQGSASVDAIGKIDELKFAASRYSIPTPAAAAAVIEPTAFADHHIWRKPAVTEHPPTGAVVTWYVLGGAVLVLAGAVVAMLARRRRTA